MLNSIRKMSNSLIIRLLLILIVISFVAFGISDVLQSRGNFDLVVFDSAKNITNYDFMKYKAREISTLQKQNNVTLTEEQIQELQIDQLLLTRLINDAILDDIVNYYDLNLSQKTVIEFIKSLDIFDNKYGEFDAQIFHSVLNNIDQKEEEYIKNVKYSILKDLLISVFSEEFLVPNMMVNNLKTFYNEERIIDLFTITLDDPRGLNIIHAPNPEVLEAFYKEHNDLFISKEKRSASYFVIPHDFIAKKVHVNDEDIEEFYQDNVEAFEGAKLTVDVRKDIKQKLIQNKFDELKAELIKNLEDDVASGLNLQEIADKYDLSLKETTNICYDDLINNKNQILADLADNIFALNVNDVSYPIESDTNIILLQVNNIIPSSLEDLSIIKDKVRDAWFANEVFKVNLNFAEEMLKNFDTSDIQSFDLKKQNISVKRGLSLIRKSDNQKLPEELLQRIFSTPKDHNTQLLIKDNKAFFAHIKKVNVSANEKDVKKSKIDKKTLEIQKSIKQSILEEMLQYFISKNNMKIHK